LFNTVTPKEAKKLLDDEGYRYLDVRSEAEFAQEHPEGSVNVPLLHMDPSAGMRPNPDFMRVMAANFPKDAKLVVGCKSGGRSARACEALSDAGYTNVVNMDGGFGGRFDQFGNLAQPGWTQERFPTSKEPAAGEDYASLAARAR
jgi:rhodanese-related sulfurtransferase